LSSANLADEWSVAISSTRAASQATLIPSSDCLSATEQMLISSGPYFVSLSKFTAANVILDK